MSQITSRDEDFAQWYTDNTNVIPSFYAVLAGVKRTDTLNKAQLPAPKKRASGSGRSTIRSHVSDLPFPQESFTVIDSPGLAPDSMFRLCGWSDMMIQFSSIIIIQTHNVVTCCFMRKCQILKVI